MGFECPSANFKNCMEHVFACIVLKSQYLKACQGRQLKIIEINFCLRKSLNFDTETKH